MTLFVSSATPTSSIERISAHEAARRVAQCGLGPVTTHFDRQLDQDVLIATGVKSATYEELACADIAASHYTLQLSQGIEARYDALREARIAGMLQQKARAWLSARGLPEQVPQYRPGITDDAVFTGQIESICGPRAKGAFDSNLGFHALSREWTTGHASIPNPDVETLSCVTNVAAAAGFKFSYIGNQHDRMAPMLTGASKPARFQPSTPWDLDYAENDCVLLRKFGEGKEQILLQIESEAPGRMEMVATGKPLDSVVHKIGARFLPVGGKALEGEFARSVVNHDPAILWSNVNMVPDDIIAKEQREVAEIAARPGERPPQADLKELAFYKSQRLQFAENATELEIQARPNRPVILETGSMGEAIKMFDKCTRDSLKDWGVDPNLDDKIVRRAWAPAPYRWFRADDYPADMAKRYEESVVNVRLLVDASGKVTKCTSLSDFKEAEFGRITCAIIMQRAHLEPAELADGTKVPSYYTQLIKFRMGW